MRDKSRKPPYSIWSNTVMMITVCWNYNRRLIVMLESQFPLRILQPLASILLPTPVPM